MDLVGGNAAAIAGGPSSDGPIMYMEPNRTSAIDDIPIFVIYIFSVAFLLGFIVIFPGIRQEKVPTLLCVLTTIILGAIILGALFGTKWHVAQAQISAPYRAFSRDKFYGIISANIGLMSVNITLSAHRLTSMPNELLEPKTSETKQNQHEHHLHTPEPNHKHQLNLQRQQLRPILNLNLVTNNGKGNVSQASKNLTSKPHSFNSKTYFQAAGSLDINYNERFSWTTPVEMSQEYHRALERGLPYPILTVMNYLSHDEAGFSWARKYRQAGYYCNIMTSLSAALWFLMLLLHCAAPKYGVYAMIVLGANLLSTNFLYANLVPKGQQRLVIPFEGQSLMFEFGSSFMAVLLAGLLAVLVGMSFVIIDSLFPNYYFTTILDLDFDARHSHLCKSSKKKRYQSTITTIHKNKTLSSSLATNFAISDVRKATIKAASDVIASKEPSVRPPQQQHKSPWLPSLSPSPSPPSQFRLARPLLKTPFSSALSSHQSKTARQLATLGNNINHISNNNNTNHISNNNNNHNHNNNNKTASLKSLASSLGSSISVGSSRGSFQVSCKVEQ